MRYTVHCLITGYYEIYSSFPLNNDKNEVCRSLINISLYMRALIHTGPAST